jgi:hypothetical protein
MYTLKNAKDQTSCQFNRKMILDAMKAFEKISKAQRLDSPDDNPRYRISHNKLIAQKSDFLDSLIRELNKEDFESRANLEYQKSLNQSLFPENHLDNQSPPI